MTTTSLVTRALAELIREQGFRKVDTCEDVLVATTVRFACAMGQIYSLEVKGAIVHGFDPQGGWMRIWDLNDPDSIPQIAAWAGDLRVRWRSVSKILRHVPICSRIAGSLAVAGAG